MTKKQVARYVWLSNALMSLGFDAQEIAALLRIEKTLHRWAERECNGEVERDEITGKTFAVYGEGRSRYPRPDRETGALRRLSAIMKGRRNVRAYHQGDPRGCALYIVRRRDVDGDWSKLPSCYSRGFAVCVD